MSESLRSSPPTVLAEPLATLAELVPKYIQENNLKGIGRGVRHQLEVGGKRLRPAWAMQLGGEFAAPDDEVRQFAWAVELLHNVLLIHDDIEDGDRYRRGQNTLWVEVGIPEALNVADYLIADAFRLVAGCSSRYGAELCTHFAEVFRTTVIGQALDLGHRADPGFDLAGYQAIVEQKTGRYLALGWVGAAVLAGRDASYVETLWSIGNQIGPAFQIRDDLLDLTPGKGRGGEIGCDIREGKPSLPFAFALENGDLSPTDRNRLILVQGTPRDETTEADVAWAIDLYDRCGALEFGEAECRRRVEAGIREFESLESPPSPAARDFRAIAEYVIERKV
ncbi:MAG: polyprenyl synthetase family protein [Planctomycetota bacterium]